MRTPKLSSAVAARRPRRARGAAALAGLILVLAACGGGGSSEADLETFCDAFDDVQRSLGIGFGSTDQDDIDDIRDIADDLRDNAPGEVNDEVREIAKQLDRGADAAEDINDNPDDENKIVGEYIGGVPSDFDETGETVEAWADENCGAIGESSQGGDGDGGGSSGGAFGDLGNGGDNNGSGSGNVDGGSGSGGFSDGGSSSGGSGDGGVTDGGSASGNGGSSGEPQRVVFEAPIAEEAPISEFDLPVSFGFGHAEITLESAVLSNLESFGRDSAEGVVGKQWVYIDVSAINAAGNPSIQIEAEELYLTDGSAVIGATSISLGGGGSTSALSVQGGGRESGHEFVFPLVEDLDFGSASLVVRAQEGEVVEVPLNGGATSEAYPLELDAEGSGTWTRESVEEGGFNPGCEGGTFSTEVVRYEVLSNQERLRTAPHGMRYLRVTANTTADAPACADTDFAYSDQEDRSAQVDGRRYGTVGHEIETRMDLGDTLEERTLFLLPLEADSVELVWGGAGENDPARELVIEVPWDELPADAELEPTFASARGVELPDVIDTAESLGLDFVTDDVDVDPASFMYRSTEFSIESATRTNLEVSSGSFTVADGPRVFVRFAMMNGLGGVFTDLSSDWFSLSDGTISLPIENVYDHTGQRGLRNPWAGTRIEGLTMVFADDPDFDWDSATLVMAPSREVPRSVSLTGGDSDPYPLELEVEELAGEWEALPGEEGFFTSECDGGTFRTEIERVAVELDFLGGGFDGEGVEPGERWLRVFGWTTAVDPTCNDRFTLRTGAGDRQVEIDGVVFEASGVTFADSLTQGYGAREVARFKVPADADEVVVLFGSPGSDQFRLEIPWGEVPGDPDVG